MNCNPSTTILADAIGTRIRPYLKKIKTCDSLLGRPSTLFRHIRQARVTTQASLAGIQLLVLSLLDESGLADNLYIVSSLKRLLLCLCSIPSSLFKLPITEFCKVLSHNSSNRPSYWTRLRENTKVTDPISDLAFLSDAKPGKFRIKKPFLDSPKGKHPEYGKDYLINWIWILR